MTFWIQVLRALYYIYFQLNCYHLCRCMNFVFWAHVPWNWEPWMVWCFFCFVFLFLIFLFYFFCFYFCITNSVSKILKWWLSYNETMHDIICNILIFFCCLVSTNDENVATKSNLDKKQETMIQMKKGI